MNMAREMLLTKRKRRTYMFALAPPSFDALFEALASWQPHVHSGMDAWREDGQLFLAFQMPGFDKGKISIVRNDRVLTVSASSEDKDEREYLFRSSGRSYEQSIVLPGYLDPDKTEADYKDGVLTVSIPSTKKASKKIEIK